MVLADFIKWNFFNNSRKYGKFVIDLVESMLNTLQTIELASISKLFTSTCNLFHTQWCPNMIQWFMYKAIGKYDIQGPECVKQWINPICATLHIFPKIIKGVLFLKRSKNHFSLFLAPTITQVLKYIGKTTTCTFYAICQHKM